MHWSVFVMLAAFVLSLVATAVSFYLSRILRDWSSFTLNLLCTACIGVVLWAVWS